MKKLLVLILLGIALIATTYYAVLYYVPYSEGVRSGELIKFSRKGFITKTWEGEISQGISGAQIFSFSVMSNDIEVINQLKKFQGNYVKVEYQERLGTFFFWGDTKYFVTKVTPEKSPHFNQNDAN